MKLAAKIICLLALFFCFPHAARADSVEQATDKQISPADNSYVWVSTENAEEPIERLPLYPARMHLYRSEGEMEEGEEIEGEQPEEKAVPIPEELPAPMGRYDAGFDIRTYRIFGPDADLSPAIIMVNERRNNEPFYFGFLSISIKF